MSVSISGAGGSNDGGLVGCAFGLGTGEFTPDAVPARSGAVEVGAGFEGGEDAEDGRFRHAEAGGELREGHAAGGDKHFQDVEGFMKNEDARCPP